MTRLLVVSLIGAGLASAPASAQLCNGSASFARSPVQLSAAVGHNTDADFFDGYDVWAEHDRPYWAARCRG